MSEACQKEVIEKSLHIIPPIVRQLLQEHVTQVKTRGPIQFRLSWFTPIT